MVEGERKKTKIWRCKYMEGYTKRKNDCMGFIIL